MSRKAFLTWGLLIISLAVISYTATMYLSLSKTLTGASGGLINTGILLTAVAGFGLILHLRFKAIGRRKRVLGLCLMFFIASWIIGAFLMLGFVMLDIFGAHDQYFSVITSWSTMNDPTLPVSWTVGQRLDFILLSWVPAFCLLNWGLIALLWFGSLDPRTPSKNRVVQFFKTGTWRKESSFSQRGFKKASYG